YLALNLALSWKKKTALPSLLAYAGIPYHVVGAREGALALTIAWIRLAMPRSGSAIAATFASNALSPSRPRAAAFWSAMVSLNAAFSSAVSPVALQDPRVGFFAVFLTAISGRHFLGDFPLLQDPDRVSERVTEAHVGAVEVLDGLLGEVRDAAGLERLVETADVVRVEYEAAHRTLGDQLADLRGGGIVVEWRTRLLEGNLRTVARNAYRQPAVRALLDVLALLEAELVDVEVEG